MQYTKPVVMAQSQKSGSYAAGCPILNHGCMCKPCENVK